MTAPDSSIPTYSIENLKASSSDTTREFELFRFEYFAKDIAHLKVPHRHDFYTFILITHGQGNHDIDFNTYALQPGRLFLIAPGQVHAWNELEHVNGFVLLFSESFIALSKGRKLLINWPLFRSGQPCYIDLDADEVAAWLEQFHAMEAEVAGGDDFSRDAIFYALGNLLVRASRLYRRSDQWFFSQDLLSAFQELIEEHFTTLKTPKEYAALLHLTPNYLNGYCKKRSGKSAGALIRQRILLEAKRLLTHTQLPVAQVAYRLNFDDNSYFGRFFKRYTGITPERFRKQQAE